ncbi:Lrp/AsnC family transcriptional regulator [Gluconacetobacter sp. 1b LMG 1731]|uniref:Lrp/AsnC family transcriptional regulator n=1 Tax=Gluconacetobacter dulcium TaxID=2729096 RepID=A0A7W4IMA3_9PROT|nr:Lrp/AsnC family transcriptional regulator [Gluconacetobacter dulcium]MBB2165515.1 Lrp/AsnC family transcriptional regulator [Gluconacetobacter dulcium]MBB2194651.1 Lrp/AsnC family transcriptional regulator [Gluconacetobacter dulcium]
MNAVTSALDSTDFRILREVAANGRVSDVQLGEKIHLSSTASARRRKILEETGVITGYTATIDLERLGMGVTVLVRIELTSQTGQALDDFENVAVRCPSVTYCYFVSGDTDFILILHVRSIDDYDRVYRDELSTLPHVAHIRSSFVIRKIAQRIVPPSVG